MKVNKILVLSVVMVLSIFVMTQATYALRQETGQSTEAQDKARATIDEEQGDDGPSPKSVGAAAAADFSSTDEAKIADIRGMINTEGVTLVLADANGENETLVADSILGELLDLGLLDLDNKFASEEGQKHSFQLVEVNILGLRAQWVIDNSTDFLTIVSQLDGGRKIAIVTTNDKEKRDLEKNATIMAKVDNEDVYISDLRDNLLIDEWLNMSKNGNQYDFLNIGIEDIVSNGQVTVRARITAN